MGLKDLGLSFALIMIFTVALLGMGIQFAVLNNSNVNIGDNYEVAQYKTGATSQGKQYSVEINDSLNAYSKSSLPAGDNSFEGGNLFQPTIYTQTKNSFSNIIKLFYVHILGGGGENGNSSFATILYVITGSLAVILVLYVYKFAIGQNPD